MKRHMIAVAVVLLFVLCGCMNNEMISYTESYTLDTLVEQSYDLYQLRDFFVPHHMDDYFRRVDDPSHEELMKQMLTYDEVNRKYPVTRLQQLGPIGEYAVYPVEQGGFYYVFLLYYKTVELMEQTPKTTDYLYVYFSAYLGNGDYSEGYSCLDYYEIVPGITTMAELRQLDPNMEYVFLSSGTYTCSLLDDTTVLQVKYGYDKNSDAHDKPYFYSMVVRRVEIKKIEDSLSCFAEILQ